MPVVMPMHDSIVSSALIHTACNDGSRWIQCCGRCRRPAAVVKVILTSAEASLKPKSKWFWHLMRPQHSLMPDFNFTRWEALNPNLRGVAQMRPPPRATSEFNRFSQIGTQTPIMRLYEFYRSDLRDPAPNGPQLWARGVPVPCKY